MSHKIFDNNLAAIDKSKLALKLNKPAYIEMCILELSKVLMCKFTYDYWPGNLAETIVWLPCRFCR